MVGGTPIKAFGRALRRSPWSWTALTSGVHLGLPTEFAEPAGYLIVVMEVLAIGADTQVDAAEES